MSSRPKRRDLLLLDLKVHMKKSEILERLSSHLDVDRLLAEHPRLGRNGLSVLLAESAAALGPVDIPHAAVPPPPRKKHATGRTLILHTDGASRGNPGEAGIGALIEDGDGQVVGKVARYMGTATNNQAEYSALIEGLKAAIELGADRVEIYADSELVVKQINGLYRVKNPDLQERHAEARALLSKFGGHLVKYIPREKNKEADALANEAIDKRLRPF